MRTGDGIALSIVQFCPSSLDQQDITCRNERVQRIDSTITYSTGQLITKCQVVVQPGEEKLFVFHIEAILVPRPGGHGNCYANDNQRYFP